MTHHDILSTLKASTGLDWKQEGETLVATGKHRWTMERGHGGGWVLYRVNAVKVLWLHSTLAACAEAVRREET